MNNYIKPSITIAEIANQHHLLAGSLDKGEGTISASESDAKGGFLWDEDEDDDPMGAPTFNVWEE